MSDERDYKWRISPFPDLSGTGGLYASGRWHSKGRPVAYLADSAAGAMLETLVHMEIDREDVPSAFNLLRVGMPADVEVDQLEPLPDDWRERPELTREIGDSWLRRGEYLLLAVPSAIMPHTENYLLNPLHPDADEIELVVERHAFDARLLRPR